MLTRKAHLIVNDLIAALLLMQSRMTLDVDRPLFCTHDELWVVGVDPDRFSDAELLQLEEWGFIVSDGGFMSFRFGSA